MILNIAIPDELYQIYVKHNPTNPQREIVNQLTRFKDVGKDDRPLIIKKDPLRAIEKLRGLPLEDGEQLQKWVESLLRFKLEGQEFFIRDGQRKKLEGEAKFYKKDTTQYLKETLQRIIDQALGAY